MITVIIATMNSERFLPSTLASLREHRSRIPIEEILFIDADSTDGTLGIIAEFGEGRVISQKSIGLYGALNEAVSHACGTHVMFLHSDDQVRAWPSGLKDLNEDCVYLGTVEFVRANGALVFTRRPGRFPRWGLNQYPLVFHPNGIYPLWALREIPYDEGAWGRKADRYQLAEMASLVRFRRVPEFVYQFRLHDMSTTARGIKSEGREPLSYWGWRVFVFLFWEDHRMSRLYARLRGVRTFHSFEAV